MILFDFECKACQTRFESNLGICPRCGVSEHVEKIFLQAPGLIGSRTKQTDALLADAAAQFGGNIQNTGKKPISGQMLWGGANADNLGFSIGLDAARGLHDNTLARTRELVGGLPDPGSRAVRIRDPEGLTIK